VGHFDTLLSNLVILNRFLPKIRVRLPKRWGKATQTLGKTTQIGVGLPKVFSPLLKRWGKITQTLDKITLRFRLQIIDFVIWGKTFMVNIG